MAGAMLAVSHCRWRSLPMSALSHVGTLRRRATAVAAAIAVIVTSVAVSAAPARASDDALIRFLLGATAVAIIIGAASSSSRSGSSAQARHRGDTLPRHCRETLSVRGQHIHVYAARCLHKAGLGNPPQQCRESVRTNRGVRDYYRARCLESRYHPGRGQNVQPRHAPRRELGHRAPRRAGLPHQCRVIYTYRGLHHAGYQAYCLGQHGLHDLPSTCLVRGQSRHIYSAACLRDVGYRAR